MSKTKKLSQIFAALILASSLTAVTMQPAQAAKKKHHDAAHIAAVILGATLNGGVHHDYHDQSCHYVWHHGHKVYECHNTGHHGWNHGLH